MQFKSDTVKAQWNDSVLHPRLVLIVANLDEFCKKNEFPEIVITDVNTPGVHREHSDHYTKPCRAVDIRAKHLSAYQLAMMDNYLTENFPRKGMSDKGYQLRCFYAHGSKETFHVHISCD